MFKPKLTHHYVLLFIFSLVLLVASCNRKGFGKLTKGMSPYGKGEFWYSIYSEHPHASKPNVGDQVRIDYSMRKGEKILSQSYNSRRPVLVQIPQPRYDNFFTKALRLMGEGDSLAMYIKAGDARELLGEHQRHFQDEDAVLFTYKMHQIKSAEILEQEIRKEIERIDSLRLETQKRIEAFEQGLLESNLQQSDSGLRYLIHEQGAGRKANSGDLVQVHYMCYLPDGSMLQDSYSNMTPMEFVVGDNTVIDGWVEGIKLLKEGASATLFIPPNLGYGQEGMSDIIPPNTTLIFYVELLTVE